MQTLGGKRGDQNLRLEIQHEANVEEVEIPFLKDQERGPYAQGISSEILANGLGLIRISDLIPRIACPVLIRLWKASGIAPV